MTTRRYLLLSIGVGAICGPLTSLAQKGKKVPVVGVLTLGVEARVAQLREGLRKLGYAEGRNLRIEVRSTGDRYAKLDNAAEELVRLGVDVIVTLGGTATLVASKATRTIPIVMVAGLDPMQAGLAQSLAHPGGNLTGISTITRELYPKRLQLMKEVMPGIAHLGIVWSPDQGGSDFSLALIQDAAKALKLNLQVVEARSPADFNKTFETLARADTRAFVLMNGSMFESNRQALLESAAKHGMAGMFAYGNWTDDGGLLSYGPDPLAPFRDGAAYVDKILKGAKPGGIPIEQPTKYELVVNLKTANALKVKIPQSIIVRADRAIQ